MPNVYEITELCDVKAEQLNELVQELVETFVVFVLVFVDVDKVEYFADFRLFDDPARFNKLFEYFKDLNLFWAWSYRLSVCPGFDVIKQLLVSVLLECVFCLALMGN